MFFTVAAHFQLHFVDSVEQLFDEFAPGEVETFAVEFDDHIAFTQTGTVFRACFRHLTDGDLPHFRSVLRHAESPDDAADKQAGNNIEQRAGNGGYHPFTGGGTAQFGAVGGFGQLLIGGVDLGQLHITAEREVPQAVLHALVFFPPEGAEPQREGVDMQSQHFGGEEVAEFMGEYAEAEGDKDKQHRTGGGKKIQKRIHSCDSFLLLLRAKPG